MKIFVKNVKGLALPKKANETDAGYDITATSEPRIIGEFIERPLDGLRMYKNVQFIEYETNLQIAPETKDVHTLVFPRSSISKTYLGFANSVAVIDNGYRGQILIRFRYNFQPEDLVILPEQGVYKAYGIINNEKIYQRNDKIGQLVIAPTLKADLVLIDDLNETERGTGGFGSTGK